MRRYILFIIAITIGYGVLYAQKFIPGKKQDTAILVSNGFFHLGNGETLEKGYLLFEDGLITYIGNERPNTDEATQEIDATGKHVYPGFISLNDILGLREIGSIRATRDHTELEDFSPNVRSLIAFNTDSDVIPTVRSNGVLIAQVRPFGGTIPGTSSVFHLDAWNWEDAVIAQDNSLHLSWPRYIVNTGNWIAPKPNEINKNYMKKVDEIYTWFERARAYCKTDSKKKSDLKMSAMCGVFDGSKKLFVSTNSDKEIIDALSFLKDFNIKDKILVGAQDAHYVADVLKENHVQVVLKGPHSIPPHAHDSYDLNYNMIGALLEKDIPVAIEFYGSQFTSVCNLPFNAGHLVGYGVDKETAVKLISLNAAKILGIDAKYGSLESGKSATFFISEGDALDMMGNKLVHAFVDGRKVDLNNKQKDLYNAFKKRYDR